MSFTDVVFRDGFRFQTLEKKRIFTLERFPITLDYWGNSELELQLYENTDYAGVAKTSHIDFGSDTEKEPQYTLKRITIDEKYRRLYLGSLLIYIISTEVHSNGSDYLYLETPAHDALGFYLRMGFFPDPDVTRHKEQSTGLSELSGSTERYFRNKFLHMKMSQIRHFAAWRGYNELIKTQLSTVVYREFKFLDPE